MSTDTNTPIPNADYATPESLRNASLPDLMNLLKDQRARALDVVVPASKLAVCDGLLVVEGTEAVLSDDGVTPADGVYQPTASFDAQLAGALKIDLRYLRRCREQRPDIYDAQVNLWLHGSQEAGRHGTVEQVYPGMARKFLLRLMRSGGDVGVGDGIARALLSSKYRRIDNFDVALAVLEGIRNARDEHGNPIEAQVVSADLTETRMHLRVACPQVRMLAPELLKNYRSPFGDGGAVRVGNGGWSLPAAREAAAREGQGYQPGAEPVVFAGFSLTNSDLGHGRWSLKPVIVVQICKNGLTMTSEAIERTHLGGELDEGKLDWSHETHRRYMELISGQTVDAVSQWFSQPYLAGAVAELEHLAGVAVTKPEETIKFVASQLSFSEVEAEAILAHFYMGGQHSAAGVMQAVSSVAQTLPDGESARELEFAAVKAGQLAASRG